MLRRFADGDGCAADFEDLFEWYRRRIARLDRSDKGRHASALALILPPQSLRPEARPTESAQPAEIIQLQYAPAGKYLDAFLRKGRVTPRHVVNGSKRSVGKSQGHAVRWISGFCTASAGTPRDRADDGAPREVSQ